MLRHLVTADRSSAHLRWGIWLCALVTLLLLVRGLWADYRTDSLDALSVCFALFAGLVGSAFLLAGARDLIGVRRRVDLRRELADVGAGVLCICLAASLLLLSLGRLREDAARLH